jgi:pyroglutamyl-peptidase
MRLLLTGFEPFGGSSINPSQQIIERLEAEGLPGIELVTAILPVDRLRGPEKLLQLFEKFHPEAVLCLGEASTRAVLSIERLAVNLLNFTIPDNQGVQVEDEPIVPGGPAAYFATLPVRKAYEAVKAAQVPVEISLSAGSYLCNQVFYTLLNFLVHQGLDFPAGFIHLPRLPEQAAVQQAAEPSMSLETSLRGIKALVEVLREAAYTKKPGQENFLQEPSTEVFPAQVVIRRATVEDIDVLVEMRLALQREIGALYADAPAEGAAETNRQYLHWAMPAGEFLAWVAEANGQLVACSGLVFYSRMPGMHGLASREAYVMNMYTHPTYRRMGIASELLNRMIQFARSSGARRIWLRATSMGRPVYEKIGFEPMESAMQLKLE